VAEYENKCICGMLSPCTVHGDWRQCKYGQVGNRHSGLCAFYYKECDHCRNLKAQKEARIERDKKVEAGV